MTSTPLEIRWNNGNGYRFNESLWAAIQRDGWDAITKEVIAVGLSEAEASRREQEVIAILDAVNPEKGYNRELGGLGGDKIISEASRKKMSKAKMGDRNPNFGTHFSDERKAKLSASNTGKKRSLETCARIGKAKSKPVAQYSRDGVLLEVFESARKACETTGVHWSHISKTCKHQQPTAGGFRWEFA
jgi:hypothetical protein